MLLIFFKNLKFFFVVMSSTPTIYCLGEKKTILRYDPIVCGPTLVEELFGMQANWPNWPPWVGGDDCGVDDTNIFAQIPITPPKKKNFVLFFALFFSSKWSFEPAPLSLSQSKNIHIYYSWNRPIPHLALARHQQKRKSFRPLLELGGEERREGHTPLN